jgi:hypothetical protein
MGLPSAERPLDGTPSCRAGPLVRFSGRGIQVTDLVEAARFDTRVEADLARLYLDSKGVEAILFDADINTSFGFFTAGLLPVRLMVLDADLVEADRLLRDYKP